jgi:hypothetical protein
MPPVPTNPEPLAALRARYPRALEHLYDAVAIRDARAIRPGEVVANVFDFEDGLRLIVSREQVPGLGRVLHVSASFLLTGELSQKLDGILQAEGVTMAYMALLREARCRFLELSGDPRRLAYVGKSSEMVPHFQIQEPSAP